MTGPEMDIECASPLAACLDLDALRAAAREVLSHRGSEDSVTLVLTDNAVLRRLNRDFREIDAPTDVLSFDLKDSVHPHEEEIGEIYISMDRAKLQAEDACRSFQEEVTHLAIHGILHLLGFEHDTDEGHAQMRRQEAFYLASKQV